jgi:hypothetical protein
MLSVTRTTSHRMLLLDLSRRATSKATIKHNHATSCCGLARKKGSDSTVRLPLDLVRTIYFNHLNACSLEQLSCFFPMIYLSPKIARSSERRSLVVQFNVNARKSVRVIFPIGIVFVELLIHHRRRRAGHSLGLGAGLESGHNLVLGDEGGVHQVHVGAVDHDVLGS